MDSPYIVRESTTREQWLENRQGVLTATQIARLMVGGPAEWRAVREEFDGERKDFTSKYLEWGTEREPFIASYANIFIDTRLKPNDQFLVSTVDSRIGATPDALGGEVIGEFKTSKHPMPPDLSQAKDTLGRKYYIQVQVQLFVTGAEACAFVWEQHNDDWVNGPVASEPVSQIVRPDSAMFAKIRKAVDRFWDGPEYEDELAREYIADCLTRLREIRYERTLLDAKEKRERDRIRELLGDSDGMTFENASVSLFTPKPTRRFDKSAFKKAHPDLHDSFLKEGKPGEPQLRITLKESES